MGFDKQPGRTLPGIPSSGDTPHTRWPHLTLLVGALPGRMHRFREPVTTLGRSMDCDITFTDLGVSRLHARLERAEDGGVLLYDLGSTNGTWLNGDEVASSPLADGDKIRLGPTVLLRYNLQDAVDEAFQRSQFEAMTRDGLTGAYNRAYFDEELIRQIAFSRRVGGSLSVCMLDLDHFKRINDTRGHAAGDRVLVAVAGKLAQMLREYDMLARVGGEEFAILMRETDIEVAAIVMDRLRRGVAELRIPARDGLPLSVTVSAGVASLSEDAAAAPAELMHIADLRLYDAKTGGRDRVVAHGHGGVSFDASTRPVLRAEQREAVRRKLLSTTTDETQAGRQTIVGERSAVARLREGSGAEHGAEPGTT